LHFFFHETQSEFCSEGGEVKKYVNQYEPEEIECGEVFDPDYHEDYFDVDEVDEYGEDVEPDDLASDLWDEEGFFDGYEEWFEE
jgi:hypothetical protein